MTCVVYVLKCIRWFYVCFRTKSFVAFVYVDCVSVSDIVYSNLMVGWKLLSHWKNVLKSCSECNHIISMSSMYRLHKWGFFV